MTGEGMGMSFGFNVGGEDSERPQGVPERPELKRVTGPATGDFPYRIMVVGDFCGMPDQRQPVVRQLVKGGLDELLARAQVQLFFDVEDLIGKNPKGIEVRLAPKVMTDFRPDRVAAQVEALAPVQQLLADLDSILAGSMEAHELRGKMGELQSLPGLTEALKQLRDALGSLDAAPATPAPSPAEKPAAVPKSGNVLDDILGMVDGGETGSAGGGETGSAGGGSAISAAASAIGRGNRQTSPELKAAREAVADVLSQQLALIMQHPQLRHVESAWRGLSLLASKTGFKKTKLELLDAAPDRTADVFHEVVFPTEYEGRSEFPLGLVVVDREFANTPADLEQLRALAEDGEQIQAPILTSAGESFLGKQIPELAKLDHPAAVFEDGFEAWQGLRKTDAARWLTLVCNRPLMRLPYTRTRRAPDFAEPIEGLESYAWGRPAWIVAAAVAKSIDQTGWPGSFTGVQDGSVDGLAMLSDEQGSTGPLEHSLPERVLKDLGKHGVSALTFQPNSDLASVVFAHLAYSGKDADAPRQAGSLGYQLVAARLGELVIANKHKIAEAGPPNTMPDRFAKFVENLVADTGPGVHVVAQGMPEPGGSGRFMVGIQATVGRFVLNGTTFNLGVMI